MQHSSPFSNIPILHHSSITEREGSCPTPCATSPMLVGRDRNPETGLSTTTGVRDGSVMNQHLLQGVHKLMTTYQMRHSAASFDLARGFRTLQKVQKTRSVKSSPHCRKILHTAAAWRPTTALSLSRSESSSEHSRNVSRDC